MRPWMLGLCTLGLLAADALPASAAWDNVFQPTLFRRRQQTVTNYHVAPSVVAHSAPVVARSAPCDTCQPQTQCSTSYTQRCYYQPVTTMQTQSYYEPVTTTQTSYYYEPVVSYRYSCYYDPCTCSYQQVATPTTSYQLRAKSCPVQSWVQRCCQVPVTVQQKVCYWQPQTTCCTTTQGAPIPITGGGPPVVTPHVTPGAPPPAGTAAPPNVTPSITNPNPPAGSPPNVDVQRSFGSGATPNPMYDRFYPPNQPNGSPPTMPPASWRPQPTTTPPAPRPPQPSVRLDSIVLGDDQRVDGQVVRSDQSPKANSKVTFVSALSGQRLSTTTNSAGRFHVTLPAGGWLVYLHGADDLPVYNNRIDVNNSRQPTMVTLVNR